MATNTVTGNLVCSDGTNIPLKTEIAEASESSLGTDAAYTIVSQDVGDFAPGKTVISGLVSCDNGVGYCYILSQGLVAAIIPWSVKGAVTDGSPALCQPYTLKAGDIVKVKVMEVDVARQRIGLTMRLGDTSGEKTSPGERRAGGGKSRRGDADAGRGRQPRQGGGDRQSAQPGGAMAEALLKAQRRGSH